MGQAQQKKQTVDALYKEIVEEINTAVLRYIDRKGEKPSNIFLGKTEAAVFGLKNGKKSSHGGSFYIENAGAPLPVWVMQSAQSMVDVG